jgi:predicted Zn-dependent peptidase
VDPAKAKQLAQKYFGRLAKAPTAPMVMTKEPTPRGERRSVVVSPAQPLVFYGYHRPDQYSDDSAALDVLYHVLTGGRTGWMYTEMVRDKQIALAVDAAPAFPGTKYPNLFVLLAVPSPGKTVEENEKAMDEIIERAKKEKVDQATLDRIKTKLRAGVISSLGSNSGLAGVLASYQANFGDWRRLFTELDDYNKVTADDVQRVAQQYLNKNTRTVVYSVTPQGGGQ